MNTDGFGLDRVRRAAIIAAAAVPCGAMVPMAARAVGLDYADLCVKILEGSHVG